MSLYTELLQLNETTINLSTFSDYFTDICTPVQFTFKECQQFLEHNHKSDLPSSLLFKIDTVIDYLHDQLNIGHWSKVPIYLRYAFTASNIIKAFLIVKENEKEHSVRQALNTVDFGLLLGAPLPDYPNLLTKIAAHLTQFLNNLSSGSETRKRTFSFTENSDDYNKISAEEINSISCPSVEYFNNTYFIPEKPALLADCISHWPAIEKWVDLNYLLKIAGNRTVPIEIGSHYVDENWSQKLMTLQEFIKNHFLSDSAEKRGYLAQHNLFDQIQELRNDIFIPDYCCLTKNDADTSEPDINAWFGPKGTVSPLHYDPKNNLLTQIFGTKQVILFSPLDTANLYPFEDVLLHNTSQINPLNVNLEKYPLFKGCNMYKCLLKPGEMLYMPPKWWHHITALDKSFSVSFWWE